MSFLKEVLRGIAIGVANIIPGVSGGTMMVSMGIYGDVIGAVTGMPKHFWKSVKFLLPYAIGMLQSDISFWNFHLRRQCCLLD